jgi:hypothetical protein
MDGMNIFTVRVFLFGSRSHRSSGSSGQRDPAQNQPVLVKRTTYNLIFTNTLTSDEYFYSRADTPTFFINFF